MAGRTFNGGDMQKFVLIGMGLLALSATTQAADNGVYLGVGIGQANVEIEDAVATAEDFEGDDLGYKLIVGVRPLDWLGFEANYTNFGEPEDTVAGTKIQTEGYGITGYAIGFLALGPVDLFAKAGVVSWDSTIEDVDFDGTDLAYGAGVQFRFLSLAVRAEYEIFDIEDLDNANMLSLGLTYTFL
jgi:opacity protein-like surface antigen